VGSWIRENSKPSEFLRIQLRISVTRLVMKSIARFFLYLWPLPNSLLGLFIGFMPMMGHRTLVLRRGTLGIYGPRIKRLLGLAPIPGGAIAITLGHVILAADETTYESSFEHEWIHVKQYLWWGPFFIPAYLLNSFLALVNRRRNVHRQRFRATSSDVGSPRLAENHVVFRMSCGDRNDRL
jgi:hypothetical protein